MGEQSFISGAHRHHGGSLASRFAESLVGAMEHALDADEQQSLDGYLQQLDPRAKLSGLLALIFSCVLAHTLGAIAALFMCAVCLALVSRLTLARLCKQVWVAVLAFTGVIALPSLFVVPGQTLLTLPFLHWHITLQGVRAAAFLIGRAETSATFALLLILTTPWTHVLKALRALGVPVVVVAILGMTHRYIFVLLHTAMQMFEARRSRVLAPVGRGMQRKMLASTAGVLLGKAFQLSSDVHLAMLSRGYRGEAKLLHEFVMRGRDYLWLLGVGLVPVLILWFNL